MRVSWALYDKTRVKRQLAVRRSRNCYYVFVQNMESDQMEEKNRLIPADEKELQDPENLIKNTEADTEAL